MRATVVYAGFLGNAGGVVTHTRLLSKALAACGYSVRTLSLDSIPYFLRFIPHAAWFLLRPIDGILAIFVKQKLARQLLKWLAAEDVGDLVVFQDIYIPWTSGAEQLVVLHALWSDNLQSLRTNSYSREQLGKWETRLLNDMVGSVVTVSRPYRDHVYSYLKQHGLHRSIGVVEPGLDSSNGERTANLPAENPADIRMLYVGALEHRKNVAFLLRAVSELHRLGVRATLDIVGGGPLRNVLTKAAEDAGLRESVVFHGPLGHEQIAIRMAEANVYVHTSVKESFSFALLEAKLAGLKTVAHADLEVPTEFIDFPVATWSEADWASAVTRVLTMEPRPFPSADYDLQAFANRIKSHLQAIHHVLPG